MVRRSLPTGGLEWADPFLLIDEMGPVTYAPGEALGAPDHPHRGFETITYLLAGEMEHLDSAGHSGCLRSGDVQWMTAGRGVVHSEMPSERLRREGGSLHGFQLWVNLPKREKWCAPRYQEVTSDRIPVATTPDGLALVRVLSGEALGVAAVIETRTPVVIQHWTLQPGATLFQPFPPDHQMMVYVFGGRCQAGDSEVDDGQLALLGEGDGVSLKVAGEGVTTDVLILGGRPIAEPMVRYGPFVMNTRDEILQAFADYQSGRMGRIERK